MAAVAVATTSADGYVLISFSAPRGHHAVYAHSDVDVTARSIQPGTDARSLLTADSLNGASNDVDIAAPSVYIGTDATDVTNDVKAKLGIRG